MMYCNESKYNAINSYIASKLTLARSLAQLPQLGVE